MAKITFDEIEKGARWLNLEPCLLQAVVEVESNGDGFLPDGRPKILFEGHIFWKQLEMHNRHPLKHLTDRTYLERYGRVDDILYKTWTKAHYLGGAKEYDRLERAKKIHSESAMCSASWGLFQIMGFNFAVCGYSTVYKMVDAMKDGYSGQLEAFGGFMTGNNLIKPLKAQDWAKFARGYNGAGYAQNKYDVKLKQAYEKCKKTHG